jgi:hypothetical protein
MSRIGCHTVEIIGCKQARGEKIKGRQYWKDLSEMLCTLMASSYKVVTRRGNHSVLIIVNV